MRNLSLACSVFVLVLSSWVFAQNPGQVQAAQQQAQHTVQAAQQSAESNSGIDYRVTLAPKFSPKPGTFQGAIPPVTITDDTKDAVIYFTTDRSTNTQVPTVHWSHFTVGNDNTESDSHRTLFRSDSDCGGKPWTSSPLHLIRRTMMQQC